MNFEKYLQETEYINFSDPTVSSLAKELVKDCKDDEEITKKCFIYVRDEIKHSGDIKAEVTTLKASDVFEYKTGWCYAKAILLTALLRANNIPTALCYQRLKCGEDQEEIYCLHGLNAVYLQKYGWYKIDPRGNKEGIDAQFLPPKEQLAFKLEAGEYDLAQFYKDPHPKVLDTLQNYKNYDEVMDHLPDVEQFVCSITKKDSKRLAVISNALLKYIFEEDIPQWFLDDFAIEKFEERICSDSYRHFGYIFENKLVGYAAIKNGTHLYNLFVDENCHRQGIAKKLWEFVEDHIEFDIKTTNSSLYAQKVYESFGFQVDGAVQIYNGMKYQPMVYKKEIKR